MHPSPPGLGQPLSSGYVLKQPQLKPATFRVSLDAQRRKMVTDCSWPVSETDKSRWEHFRKLLTIGCNFAHLAGRLVEERVRVLFKDVNNLRECRFRTCELARSSRFKMK